MKKVFFILLSIIYLASSAGATVQLHYCMDKLVGAGMHDDTENDVCGNCGMKKKDGCCKDESKQIKIADDQKPSAKFFLTVLAPEAVLATTAATADDLYLANNLHQRPFSNSPPDRGIAIYKYLRVFRI